MTINYIRLASHAGFAADATVTSDGRVDIAIDETDPAKLASLLTQPAQQPQQPQQRSATDNLPTPSKPPPPLHIVIQIVGSRGDVQPFVALGRVLHRQHGHRVRLVTHAVFRDLVQQSGLEFYDIGGGDPAELMSFMVGNGRGLVPPPETFHNGALASRRRFIEAVLHGCWASMVDDDNASEPFVADAIIANPPSFAHVHIAEALGVPLHIMFTMPWTPTRAFPHPLANLNLNLPSSSSPAYKAASLLSYTLVDGLAWQGLGDMINRFRVHKLGLAALSPLMAVAPFSSPGGLLGRLQIPTTYCWSPALLPKPADWAPHVSVAGYFWKEETGADGEAEESYTPSPALAAFLAAGPPPVYIGFGSIVVDDPEALTRLVLDAVDRLKSRCHVRVIIAKGWGGLGGQQQQQKDVFFLEHDCPHEWLFPRMACVVHHGGAGTTAAGLRAGLPTVVVPFFGDQPFWGGLVAQAGAGPRPIPYNDPAALTPERLAEAIQAALRPDVRDKAKLLGDAIRAGGSGTAAGAAAFHRHLPPSLSCHVAADQPAVWCYNKTLRLSALGAAVLVQAGAIAYSDDLRLLCAHEYVLHTDDQPQDPLFTGAGAALVGDLTSIAMAVADFPHRELFGDNKTTLDTAVQATKSVGRIVTTGLQSPLNFCTGMARGFHNAPRLYNDDTVRNLPGRRRHDNDNTDAAEGEITGLGSGMRAAGKAFGLGLYDGITGLVTQPMRSGGLGGLAKGIGGLVLKPAAGAWAVPAYTMQGVQAEVQRIMASIGGDADGDSRTATDARRKAARMQQGVVALAQSTPEERQAILDAWRRCQW